MTINNICTTDNGVDKGIYSWWNGDGPIFNYNRLTYVYTATIAVTCSQTHHLKIAIGDAYDQKYDSGIFLEENSLTSNNFTGSATFSNPQTGRFLVEGCSDATLTYEIPEPRATDMTINLVIDPSGTADQADILPNPFPLSVVIPAGMLQTSPIYIIPVADGTPESAENLVISASTTVCSTTNSTLNEFLVNNYNQLSVNVDNVTVCDGSQATLSANVTGGQPVLPSNTMNYSWSNGATTSSISVSPPPGHNLYRVTVTDACGQNTIQEASVDVGTAPGSPGAIAGPSTLCTPSSGVAYSVSAVTGADSYIWTLPPGAAIISGVNTNSITVDFSTAVSTGNISVRGHSNVCADGNESVQLLTINPSPEPAGLVSGPDNVCQGLSEINYSIDPLNFTTVYEWTVPAGVTIVSGEGTSHISCIITPTAVSGDFSVRGHNDACGFGGSATLPVTILPLPGDAGPISGTSTLCTPITGLVYTVPLIAAADRYIWAIPAGSSITSGTNTNSITVDFVTAATSGNISVRGHSDQCGDGAESAIPLTINPSPEPAGTINGLTTVCQGTSLVLYSIDPLDFTTNYDWSVPSGVSIIYGDGTSQISCLITKSAVSGDFIVRGHNQACGFGTPSTLSVTIEPLPGDAGTILSTAGSDVCQGQSAVSYSISPITNAVDYLWSYTGSGATLTTHLFDMQMDLSANATSGLLTVIGQNGCGTGTQSPSFPINVKIKPEVTFSLCNTISTTKNGRRVKLKGGSPLGSGGVYSGTGVTMVSPEIYAFDPASSSVIGGTPVNGIDYPVTYRYTNTQGCSDSDASSIVVYKSNDTDPCPGTMKDLRDGKFYPTFYAGTGANGRCWMAANLDYGIYTDKLIMQTDNCVVEKYCENNQAAQ
ncbi:MAG: choice-of-anchor L domain-containing protein, partial [Bacteroidetes bacterium]|nr:choice-of-anchor L domain-containing protein [Bacteroidota bacterium]